VVYLKGNKKSPPPLQGDKMIMTFTVTVPDDTITSERINHDVLNEEIKAAIADSMILDNSEKDIAVVFRGIETYESWRKKQLILKDHAA
jgi:hypothetical protein